MDSKRVLCIQLNDGVQSGPEVEIRLHFEGQTATDLMQRKLESARRNGWRVDYDPGSEILTTSKEYPQPRAPGDPARVERRYRQV